MRSKYPLIRLSADEKIFRFSIPIPLLGQARRARSRLLKRLDLGRAGLLVSAVGLLLMIFFISRGVSNYKLYNSPFDEVDFAAENEQGFLPLVYAADPELEVLRSAPQLDGQPLSDAVSASPLNAGTGEGPVYFADGQAKLESGMIPERLLIPAIDLYVPIVPATLKEVEYEGKIYGQWQAPAATAAGWHAASIGVGVAGNTVLNGHHNIYGSVFKDLYTLQPGQVIQIKSGDQLFTYRIDEVMILPEKHQPVEVRLENARWIQPSEDERLTLVTCWPDDGNSHRVIVVALPVEEEAE